MLFECKFLPQNIEVIYEGKGYYSLREAHEMKLDGTILPQGEHDGLFAVETGTFVIRTDSVGVMQAIYNQFREGKKLRMWLEIGE